MTEDPVEIPIEDWIDLHTFRPQEVKSVVEEYLFQAVKKGYMQIRIIHGRGLGIQREMVRQILGRHPEVHSFEDAPDRGSTLVYFRMPG